MVRIIYFMVFPFAFGVMSCSASSAADSGYEAGVLKECIADYRRPGAAYRGCVIGRGGAKVLSDDEVFGCGVWSHLLEGYYENDMRFIREDLNGDDAGWAEEKSGMAYQAEVWSVSSRMRAELVGYDYRNDKSFTDRALRNAGITEANISFPNMGKLLESAFGKCRAALANLEIVLEKDLLK